MRRPVVLTFALCSLLPIENAGAFVSSRYLPTQRNDALKLSLSPLPSPPSLPSVDFKVVEEAAQNAFKFLQNVELPSLSLSELAFLNEVPSLKELALLVKNQVEAFDGGAMKELDIFSADLQSRLLEGLPQSRPFFEKMVTFLGPILESPAFTVTAAACLTFVVANLLLTERQTEPQSQPYPSGRYDPDSAAAYFERRPLLVLSRALNIVFQSAQFGFALLSDKINDKLAENEYQRGRELAKLLTVLGPTYIKVGQSLSIRTDLLSPAYIRGLETLQDQVPAFDTSIAKQILESEWGRPVSEILVDELSVEPVAAASLGQVYKAKLRTTGQEVAIKVQRPDITEQIALDMFLLRKFAAFAKSTFKLNTDTVATVDAWGLGFIDELDYLQEARNAEFFIEKIQTTQLADVVFAPKVCEEYSTRSVLVTEWVDGERLDRSNSGDVTVLCSVAMNTYLTMLLELGVLHCDPHPGNLLRARDGRLCILDWGMVSRLDKNLQLTLIEHMAHLTSADYGEVPRDLLLLGFIPPEKADLIEDSGVVDLLAEIYGAWTTGGGVAAINVNQVVAQLQDLTAKKGNIFQIPPYFAYIAKSFSVLEGIGLSNDPKYSIINECLPYISQRLLTDKDNMGPALSTFIFGSEKSKPDRIVNYRRVEQLIEGFGEYTASSSGALLGKGQLSRTQVLDEAADKILELVLAEEETPLQQIMLEQLAKIVTAGSRSIFNELLERSGTLPSGRTVLGTIVDPLGIWRSSPLVRVNEWDKKTVETTRKIVDLMQRRMVETNNPIFNVSNLSQEEAVEMSSILIRKVWARRTGVFKTGNRFARQLLQLTVERLELGERVSPNVPQLSEAPAEKNGSVLPALPRRRIAESHRLQQARGSAESRRLQQARSILTELQNEALALPEVVVPAKSDFVQ